MRPVPVGQARCLVFVLDYFSPTAAVVSAKTNLPIFHAHRVGGIRNGRQVVIVRILKPDRICNHKSPAVAERIRLLRPIIACPSYPIETVLQQIAEFAITEITGGLLWIEIAEHG